MTDIFHADDDATPLTPEEREDLIPTHITLRRELNELEQTNIAKASQWAFERKRDVLDESFLKSTARTELRNISVNTRSLARTSQLHRLEQTKVSRPPK